MTRRVLSLLLLVATLVLAGCWMNKKPEPYGEQREARQGFVWKSKLSAKVRRTLDKADSFDLYSLEPEVTPEQAKGEKLHDWPMLGKTTVSDPQKKKELFERLDAAIAEPGKGGAKCFQPRHAIRVDYHGDLVELLICFECGWVYVYVNGEQQHPHEEVDRAVQPAFDDVLRDAGVPLAKKRS
jgi:hypothetical protein